MGAESNPISPDPKIRAAAVAHLDRVMECGQQFGCEILCGPLHSAIGVFSGTGPTEEEFKYGVETLQQAAEKAQARGIKLALESLNRFECYFLTTAAQTVRFVHAVNHPSCKMMYDSFHAHIEEKNQAKAILACAADTIHVHVSENDRGTPGTGQVDWSSFWSGLKQSGYNGYLTIEAFGTALPALAAATKVWRALFPDAMGLCHDGLAFMQKHAAEPLDGPPADGDRSGATGSTWSSASVWHVQSQVARRRAADAPGPDPTLSTGTVGSIRRASP